MKTKEEFIKICDESISMLSAASKIDLPFSTFKRRAIEYGCYNTNMSGKGIFKSKYYKLPIKEVLTENSNKNVAKNYILSHNLLEYKCKECNRTEWNNKSLILEFHHKNGNNKDNRLENVEFLCPNCHSQTDNWRKQKQARVVKLVDAVG